MSKIIELRNKRNTLWEQTKAFLEEHRNENGLVEADAVETYNKMAADVKALGDEIQRLEDQMEMDRVRKSWSDATSQKGAFKVLEYAKACADENPGYSVFDSEGTKVYACSGRLYG